MFWDLNWQESNCMTKLKYEILCNINAIILIRLLLLYKFKIQELEIYVACIPSIDIKKKSKTNKAIKITEMY